MAAARGARTFFDGAAMSDDNVLPFPNMITRIDALAKAAGFSFRYYTLVNRMPVAVHCAAGWAHQIGRREMMQRTCGVDPWRVDETVIGDARVSTAFLGVDHRFSSQGPPILFETMIFCGRLEGFQNRCCTWEEAEKMHADAVRQVRAGRLRVVR